MCIVFLGYSYSTSICGDQAKGLSGEEEGCWLQCHLGRQSSMWLWGLEEAAKMPLRILGVLWHPFPAPTATHLLTKAT